jgi:phospholipase D1/2
MRLTLNYEQQTISRAITSMVAQLQTKVGAWQNYLQFFGLRNHGRRTPMSQPVTEIIYIHSKLMIVDDDRLIVGSANLNDRSMNGDRDS